MSDLPDGILFGLLPRETIPGEGLFRCAAAAGIEPLPRSKWEDWDLSSVVGQILNQGRSGSCVGQGSAKACEMATRLTGAVCGTFNGFVVYANCFSGRVSWNSGTSLERGLQSLRDFGAPEVSADWPAEATTRWPSDWKDRCAQHRVTEFIDFDGDSERVFALMWTMGQRFGMPSIMGASRCWGGGHCTAVSGGRLHGGNAYLNGPNSWGDSWSNCGRPGFWEFAESRLSDLREMGCWGCTVTTEPTR